MATPLRVLFVEDQEDDALLLVRELTRAGYELSHDRVESAAAIEAALERQQWDLVISDHGMPSFTGTEALRIVRRLAPDVPFIFVSGSIGEDVAVAAMRAGAQDYVMKGNIRRLVPAVARELHDAQGRRRERFAEEQLRSKTEVLRSVFAASPLAILATDADGLLRFWNPAAERLFGWPAADVLGSPLPIIHPRDRVEWETRRDAAMAGEAFESVETHHVRQDGSQIAVSVSGAATYDSHGHADGLTIVVQDLTERKLLEAQFLQAQKMEAIGRLAGGVAHDFNNLLTVIVSYSDLLRMGFPEDDPRMQDLMEIRRAAGAASALTRQLLAFSRQQTIQPTVVEINDVVSGCSNMLKRLIGDVALDVRLDPHAGSVKVDAGQLEQVIVNLAVNARDAMPDGGALFIETRRAKRSELDAVSPQETDGRDFVVLMVTDTGSGMDEATQSRIFEPFFTTKEVDKGTGLGLSTVYGIVKQYEGVIRVQSAVGAGTTFNIYLPTVDAELDPTDTPLPELAVRSASGTIMLVEDNAAVRSLVRRVLDNAGYAVLETPDGSTALRIAEMRVGKIDLLLTDILLPGMDGQELAHHFLRARPHARVLFTSGGTDETADVTRAEHSPHAVLRKPFTLDALLHAVRQTLE